MTALIALLAVLGALAIVCGCDEWRKDRQHAARMDELRARRRRDAAARLAEYERSPYGKRAR